jgi:hypothetical protein
MAHDPLAQRLPGGRGEEVVLADAVGRIDRIIGQDHQTELVGQPSDGSAVEARQEDAFLDVITSRDAERSRASTPDRTGMKRGRRPPLPTKTQNLRAEVVASLELLCRDGLSVQGEFATHMAR